MRGERTGPAVSAIREPLPGGDGGDRLYLDADAVGADGIGVVFRAPSDLAAAVHLVDRARRAAAHVPTGLVRGAVIGQGMLSELVRQLVRPVPAGVPPEVIIDVTGDPALLTEATERLPPLGTLVLACETSEVGWDIDLYPDVHARGLVLVGVGPEADADDPAPEDPLVQRALAELRPWGDGAPGEGWLWCRVDHPL
jgi:hypothetical protein